MLRSLFPVVCCRDLDRSRDFYCSLLDLAVLFECGWYTTLASPGDPTQQIALVLPDHESVPASYGVGPAGVLITVEVDDAAAACRRAVEGDVTIVQPLRDEEFGQRHFMAEDPNGLLVDIVETTRPTLAFLRGVAKWKRDHR